MLPIRNHLDVQPTVTWWVSHMLSGATGGGSHAMLFTDLPTRFTRGKKCPKRLPRLE